ncbi:sporulation protein YqfD [Lachnospiraceae bacterium LCP25S3_G4]
MLRSIIRYLRGYLIIRVIGYSPERFLNLCSHHQIYLWDLKPSNNSYQMCISVRDFKRLKPIKKKTGTKIIVCKKCGLRFILHHYRKRKVFMGGMILCISIIYLLSLNIWNINVTGNKARTDETITEYLAQMNVTRGMKKKEVKCDKIAKSIRKQFDNIIWVSVAINGSKLEIKVKEKDDLANTMTSEAVEGNDILADKPGVITKIITRKGVPQVHKGDTIEQGTVLVSGRLEIKNDSGEVIGYQYVDSDAEIWAQTQEDYNNTMSSFYELREYSGIEKKSYFVQLPNNRFSFGAWKHTFKEYERTDIYHQLKIGSYIEFPIILGTTNIKHYTSKEIPSDKTKIRKQLTTDFIKYCDALTKKRVEIIQKDVKIHIDEKNATASGTLMLNELIGTKSPTEVLTIENKEKTEEID